METICWAIITAITAIIATCCDGLPARGCPKYSTTFYVPDKINRCVYYRCYNGHFIGGPQACQLGRGMSLFYSSDSNPCTVRVSSCLRDRNIRGGPVTFPGPTKSMFTYRPTTTTPPPEVTTEEQTTELIGMTTEEEPDMTTEMEPEMTTEVEQELTTEGDDVMTDAPGSGDDDDVMPGTPGVFFDKTSAGGLPVTASTQDDCLKTCSQVMSLCWGLDWDSTASTCNIHLTLSGAMCGTLVSKPNNVHFRFRC